MPDKKSNNIQEGRSMNRGMAHDGAMKSAPKGLILPKPTKTPPKPEKK